jgi:hypothetical protein
MRAAGIAMLQKLAGTAVCLVMSAGFAHAQVTGAVPGTGSFDDQQFYWNTPSLGENSRSPAERQRDQEIERKYREVVNARIPDRKPASNDPWRTVRAAPSAAVYDRHRPE